MSVSGSAVLGAKKAPAQSQGFGKRYGWDLLRSSGLLIFEVGLYQCLNLMPWDHAIISLMRFL